MNKVLVFEGAGWAKADGKSDIGNCRIRTRLLNNEGRLIYLEIGGIKLDYKNKKWFNVNYDFRGRVDHCFYFDNEDDKKKSSSKELSHVERSNFEYTKENLLKFVNENLNCSYTNLKVINDGSIRVHDTIKALC